MRKEVYCFECEYLDRDDIKKRNSFYHMLKYNLESFIYNKCTCPDRPKTVIKNFYEKKIITELYCININKNNDCKNYKKK